MDRRRWTVLNYFCKLESEIEWEWGGIPCCRPLRLYSNRRWIVRSNRPMSNNVPERSSYAAANRLEGVLEIEEGLPRCNVILTNYHHRM
jgi:hypothetical protein